MVEALPGADVAIAGDVVRAASVSGLHYVGGATVGRVLDGSLRVKGVDGLYVVDASTIPSMPQSAGPMSSLYMLAEHAVDALIRRYGGECQE